MKKSVDKRRVTVNPEICGGRPCIRDTRIEIAVILDGLAEGLTIEDIIAEGDRVWYLEKDTGTDSSGKRMDATSLNILRIADGKAVEGWGGYLQKTT